MRRLLRRGRHGGRLFQRFLVRRASKGRQPTRVVWGGGRGAGHHARVRPGHAAAGARRGADRQPLGPARHRGAGRRLAGVVRPGKRFRRRQRHPQRRRPAVRLRHLGRPGPRRRWRIEPGRQQSIGLQYGGQLEIASWRDMGMGALFKASDNYRVNNLVNYLSPEFSGWQWGVGLRLRRRKRRHRAVRPQPGFSAPVSSTRMARCWPPSPGTSSTSTTRRQPAAARRKPCRPVSRTISRRSRWR
ncbi:outer membrane porin protein OmpQ [Bordetella pertussis]|nr:outer membrane porin protein OmpQ [Bordetella pertussis]